MSLRFFTAEYIELNLVECLGEPMLVDWEEPDPNGDCFYSMTSSHEPGSVFQLGVTEVVYTLTDMDGNEFECAFNVAVDFDAEAFADDWDHCPINQQVVTDDCDATAMPFDWLEPIPNGECYQGWTSTHNPGDIFELGETIVEYTLTDFFNQQHVCSFTIQVAQDTDKFADGIDACPPGILFGNTGECDASGMVMDWTDPFPNNECYLDFYGSHEPGESFPIGFTDVVYTLIDMEGDDHICYFAVLVENDTDKFATDIDNCPGNQLANTGECDAASMALSWEEPFPNDECYISFDRSHEPGDQFPLGFTDIEYTLTLMDENVVKCNFTVFVENDTDKFADDWDNCPGNQIVNTGECAATGFPVDWLEPFPNNECYIGYSSTHEPGEILSIGLTDVVYTLIDMYEEEHTCSFSINVQNDTDKFADGWNNCPSNLSVNTGECDATGLAVDWAIPEPNNECYIGWSSSHDPGSEFPVGTTLVSYTLIDMYEEEINCLFNVHVDNATDLFADGWNNCPPSLEINTGVCDAESMPVTWTLPEPNNECYLDFTSSHESGQEFPIGETDVTYTLYTMDSQPVSCSFTISIENDTDQFADDWVNCPENIVSLTGECEIPDIDINWEEPFPNNNCYISLNSTHEPGDNFPQGITQVVYTMVDMYHQDIECSFTVTIDLDPATIANGFDNCPAPVQVTPTDCDADGMNVFWDPPVPNGLCFTSVSSTHNPGDFFEFGTTSVVYSMIGMNGNVYQCSFNVLVADAGLDVTGFENCPGTIEVPATDCDGTTAPVYWEEPFPNAPCYASISSNYQPGDIFTEGNTQVIYTVTDYDGNEFTCEFTVRVEGGLEATGWLNCPTNTFVDGGLCELGVPVYWEPPIPNGSCYEDIYSAWQPGDIFPPGTTQVTYELTLLNGDIVDCHFLVLVAIDMALFCPNQVTVSIEPGETESGPIFWNDPVPVSSCELCLGEDVDDYEFLGTHEGHNYYLYEGAPMTYLEAQAMAQDSGGYLAVINRLVENELVYTHLPDNLDQPVFFGYEDLGGSNEFAWINGEDEGLYSNWGTDFPSNSFQPSIAVMMPDGTWEDVPAGTTLERFVIEVPCSEVTVFTSEAVNGASYEPTVINAEAAATDLCEHTCDCEFDVIVTEDVVPYCDARSVYSASHIRSFATNSGFTNFSRGNQGYGDFTDLTAEFFYSSSKIRLQRRVLPPNHPQHYWRVWVDWNEDGDFYDEDEVLFEMRTSNNIEEFIEWPDFAEIGMVKRMRIGMARHVWPEPCGVLLNGEYEDYWMEIIPHPIYDQPNFGQEDEEPETALSPEVNIYPNPAHGFVYLDLAEYAGQEGLITIYSNLGEPMQTIPLTAGTQQMLTIDVEGLPNGFYLMNIQLNDESEEISKFFFVEH